LGIPLLGGLAAGRYRALLLPLLIVIALIILLFFIFLYFRFRKLRKLLFRKRFKKKTKKAERESFLNLNLSVKHKKMVKKQSKKKRRFLTLFFGFFVIALIFNFTYSYLGIHYAFWHLFVHGLIVIFSMGALLLSLELNEKAMKYIVFGLSIIIIMESIYFLSHIFEEYYFLETTFIPCAFLIAGIFLVMFGFKEAAK